MGIKKYTRVKDIENLSRAIQVMTISNSELLGALQSLPNDVRIEINKNVQKREGFLSSVLKLPPQCRAMLILQ